MNETLNSLYKIIINRKNEPVENSYTCYLFREGLNKILKKCGEECSEVIIAAKDGKSEEIKSEVSDLLYHILVLLAEVGIDFSEIEDILSERTKKIGNLKTAHNCNRDS